MRKPKLRKKIVKGHQYWFTAAAGSAYFGKVGDVTYEEAKHRFADHIGRARATLDNTKLTVAELFHNFLDWIEENRSTATYKTRRRECNSFARFIINNLQVAQLLAIETTSDVLQAWRDTLRTKPDPMEPTPNDRERRGLDTQSLLHAETSIRHAFNWACKHPSPTSLLPVTFQPFRGVERTKPPRKALNESDLLDDSEVDALLDSAKFDVAQFCRWGIEAHIKKYGHAKMRPCKDSFPGMLRVYHATGPRTSELANAKVGDFSPRSRQIILGTHKRSQTEKTATVRAITLGDDAFEIVKKNCAGRGAGEPIFLTAWGKPWNKVTLNRRLHSVRRIAAALGATIRDDITIYDFRHLWISDQLMAGTELLTVARMAGTSVAMVERVYGHFRKDHLIKAQHHLEETRRLRREHAGVKDRGAST